MSTYTSNMFKYSKLWLSIVFVIPLLYSSGNASASECPNIDVIYARGSGQSIGAEMENEVKKQITEKLNSINVTADFKSLSKQMLLGINYDYPAVAVWGWDNSNNENDYGMLNGVEAIISGQEFGAYKNSVQNGIENFFEFIDKSNCKETNLVLVGYSQGADVIGKIMSDERFNNILHRVKYIGLLGDPKLDIKSTPQSMTTDPYWYRGSAIPYIQGGILISKTPYDSNIPNLRYKFGSWCHKDDMICTMTGTDAGHRKYSSNGDINNMALEIANVINYPNGTDKSLKPPEACTNNKKQDIVVLLDTSPVMRRNNSLFTDTKMWEKRYVNNVLQPARTAGQALLESGCGDTRLAVVSYGREQDGPPQLLMDFTSNPNDYDTLLKNLYLPATNGVYERTQLREGARFASNVSWRSDAGKTVVGITGLAGTGPTMPSKNWNDPGAQSLYYKDQLSQQLIDSFREKQITFLGFPVPTDTSGFTIATNENPTLTQSANVYLKMMSSVTPGGYTWLYDNNTNYGWPNFKYYALDKTINKNLSIRSATKVSVSAISGEVGKPVTIKVNDQFGYLAAADKRGDSKTFTWYLNCADIGNSNIYKISQEISYIPSVAGDCRGAVQIKIQSNVGAGCSYGCPEPYPPYALTTIPFDIQIKPAGYVAKIPGPITEIEKTIHDNDVVYTWAEPEYYGDEELVYLIREEDGSILAATRSRKLTITDTHKTDPHISIDAVGEDGKSKPISSTNDDVVKTYDLRTADKPVQPENSETQTSPEAPKLPLLSNRTTLVTPSSTAVLSPTANTFATNIFSDATNGDELYFGNTLGSSSLTQPVTANQKFVKQSTVQTNSNSRLSILAIPLSIAVALGLLIAAAVYIKLR